MNGFFIITEISSLQQFLKLKDPAVDELIKNCERSINNTMHAETSVIGSFLIFNIKTGLDNSSAVIESVEILMNIIAGYREDIHEFSMLLIFRNNIEPEELIPELKQSYFAYCEDNSLLIEKRIVEASGRRFDEENNYGHAVISIEEENDDIADLRNTEKYLNQTEIDKIKRLVIPDIETDFRPGKIIIQGDSEFILLINTLKALEDFCVRINFLDNETDVTKPFARSVDMDFYPLVENYLHGVETKIWRKNKARLVKTNSDYPEEYFFTVYCLYVKAVLRYLKSEVRPQVILYNGLEPDSEIYISFIQKLTAYLEIDCEPVNMFIAAQDKFRAPDTVNDFFTGSVRKECCSRITAPECMKNLNYANTRMLFAVKLVEGLLDYEGLNIFFGELGYNTDEIKAGLNELAACGCILSGKTVQVMRNADAEEILSRVQETKSLYNALAVFVENNLYSDYISDLGLAALRLLPATEDETAYSAIYKILNRMLDFGHIEFVLDLVDELNKRRKTDYTAALKLRAMLLDNNKDACVQLLKNIPDKQYSPESIQEAILMLETSKYYHAAEEYRHALDYVKKVLIYLQAGDYPAIEGAAFIELGFLMLCKGKLLESSEYLNLAIERLTGSGDEYNLMKATFFSAVQQYIWGSLDISEDYIEKAGEIAAGNGYQEWFLYITFFRCRLYFELGRYYDTEKLLAECLLNNEILRDGKRRRLFLAWTARACLYQGKIYRGLNMLLSLEEDPEVLFFLAEAYYFNGNLEKALASIEKADGDDEYFKLGFMPLEYISWRNGFISIEGRILRSEKGTGVLLHNIRAMHAFILGLTGNRDFGTEILFSLTRDEKISENDPYNRHYFYIYTQLLERRPDADMIDKLTLMSKALKYLQQTSSRINDPGIRREFMSKNYWNSKLVSEAQKEKLI